MQFNSFKTGGIIHTITETEFIKGKNGDFAKRELWLEVPTQSGMDNKTQIFKFEVLFDEAASLDYYEAGQWVDVVFTIKGRLWKDKTKPDAVEKLFNSNSIIDMKKGPNPFDKGKDLRHTPDDLSNTIVSELGDKVKDWVNEDNKQDTLFDEDGNLKPEQDSLPF